MISIYKLFEGKTIQRTSSQLKNSVAAGFRDRNFGGPGSIYDPTKDKKLKPKKKISALSAFFSLKKDGNKKPVIKKKIIAREVPYTY